jgi:hypothetical protein
MESPTQPLCFPLGLLILIAGSSPAHAQVDATAASVIIQSEEIKPWPEYDCHGNGFGNLDIANPTSAPKRLKGPIYGGGGQNWVTMWDGLGAKC